MARRERARRRAARGSRVRPPASGCLPGRYGRCRTAVRPVRPEHEFVGERPALGWPAVPADGSRPVPAAGRHTVRGSGPVRRDAAGAEHLARRPASGPGDLRRGGTVSAPVTERTQSVGDLLGDVTRDMSTLFRQEVDLAKAELREEAVQAGKAGGMFGGAALAGFLTVLFLSYAAWWGLSNVMDQGWAALIVAAFWAVVTAITAVVGRSKLKQLREVLPRTQQTARQVPDALRGR
ncbi:phage holin family protein [Micromonospora sp. WP24]|nr:phage holin family protein [Micromonospora sp. WP24]